MSSTEEARNSVEFIAFLLWYSFLVFCCVLPTCCAYRRRQMLMQLQREEAEFEQRYFFGQFGVPNNDDPNRNGMGMDDEEARAERTTRITAALKATSFLVAEKDIVESKEQQDADLNVNVASNNEEANDTKVQADEEMGEGTVDNGDFMTDQQNTTLQLPSDGENAGSRMVPGGCAICLDSYNEGDEVIWSPLSSCPHAFHKDCIIPWLAKKEEPKCPCCRQTFCEVEPVRATAESAAANQSMDPFGLIPSGFIMRQNISHNGRELIIIPSANLIVSQTVDDRGMLGLRIAERGGDLPTARGAENPNEEVVEENGSATENDIETNSNHTGDLAAAQASSEIEMEELGERQGADEEEASSAEQGASRGDPPASSSTMGRD